MIPIFGRQDIDFKGIFGTSKGTCQASGRLYKIDHLQGIIPVIGVELSEMYSLCDEYLDFFPEYPYVRALAKRAFMIDEFLIRPGDGDKVRISPIITLTGLNQLRIHEGAFTWTLLPKS